MKRGKGDTTEQSTNGRKKRDRIEELRKFIKPLESVGIAFSGGVDSSFLAAVAYDVLGKKAVAITIDSPVLSKEELEEAKEVASEIGISQKVLYIDDLGQESFKKNDEKRCYYCKKNRYERLVSLMEKEGIRYILDGTNKDDEAEYRPGMKAVEELSQYVISPLRALGFKKAEIRDLSAILNLSTARKPSKPCLATRIPYGETIDSQKLIRIEKGERFLAQLFDGNVRLRDHGDIARIEIDPHHFSFINDGKKIEAIIRKLKKLGFIYITLDLAGFTSGSLNKKTEGKDL